MFKITFLLFVALVRGQTPLPGETVAGKYPVVEDQAPYDNKCPNADWDSHADEKEPGEGTHAKPFYAVLGGAGTGDEPSARCDEMFALFKSDPDFDETPTYLIVAANEFEDSTALEIGDLACAAIENDCSTTYGVALKLPQITVLAVGGNLEMCDGFNVDDSGEGGDEDSPFYVYVDHTSTQKLFAGLEHCGRLYQFGEEGAEKYVVVAGITDGADGDGLELVVRAEECTTVAGCGLEGYAIWTGETFTPPTTTEETTDSPSETSTTESTTSSRLPLDTTTEEDSTFFAAVGFTLFALLA